MKASAPPLHIPAAGGGHAHCLASSLVAFDTEISLQRSWRFHLFSLLHHCSHHLFWPDFPVTVLSMSFDSSTLMVGVLGLLLLFGSRPLLWPPGSFGGRHLDAIGSEGSRNSFAPSKCCQHWSTRFVVQSHLCVLLLVSIGCCMKRV